MNEQQTILSDMADGLFAQLGSTADLVQDWPRIEELGLSALLADEAEGGFGGTWDDARVVFRLAGYHALALPVTEAIIAQRIGALHGFSGRGTIAAGSTGAIAEGLFTGIVSGAVASAGADYILSPAPNGGAMLLNTGAGQWQAGQTLSGEARDHGTFAQAPAVCVDVDVMKLGAFARTAQIAGALDAALALSVGYVNERKQFGRPLAKFQAVQQNLALFAGEAAAANCAAVGAAQALDRGQGDFEVAAAKLRANRAVGAGTALAHQAHGAIGFTQEYHLHPLTRRLWSWRSEFGGDSYWSAVLGARMIDAGADRFWAELTSPV